MTIQDLVIPVVASAVLLGTSACQPGEDRADTSSEVSLPAASSTESLKSLVAQESIDVEHFYQFASYRPVWVQGGEMTPRGQELVAALKNAGARGLDPQNYDSALWDSRVSASQQSSEDAARLEVALTANLIRYASDVRWGRWNPEIYKVAKDAEHRTAPISDVAWNIATNSSTIAAGLETLDPPFEDYKRLQAALQRYRALTAAGLATTRLGATLAEVTKPIEPGGTYESSTDLMQVLRATGDLAADAEVPANGIYSGALVAAVKRFQSRHGLEPDGRLGNSTIAELNVPPGVRVRQIELAMERWRWLPHTFQRGPILVNVPQFQLRAFDESNHVALEMRVVTGESRKHPTPLFAGEMKYVVFGPYWNVPPSIQQKELLPKIRKDREYLAKHSYEVVTQTGEVVTNGEISDEVLAELKNGRLGVRQAPGAENSLGRVKFMFPNENNVYLHDTPSRSLFARARRDLSHGCVRVEKPQQLAEWVLRNESAWTAEKIDAALKDPQQRQANLKTPIPVFILYHTAAAGEDGQIRFFRDIYKQDAELEARIAKGKTVEITSGGRGPRPRG